MDNEITVTLTGSAANDYIRNTSLDEASIAMLQEENSRLVKALEELQIKYDELKSSVNSYDLVKSSNVKFDNDKAIIEANSYKEEKSSPFKKSINTVDSDWRLFVDTNIGTENTVENNHSRWTKLDSNAVLNAIDKTDRKYYSVKTLSKHLNRSEDSVRSRAIKVYGAHIKNGMIVSKK